MKAQIKLEDDDVDKIANAVAAKIKGALSGKKPAAAAEDDTDNDADADNFDTDTGDGDTDGDGDTGDTDADAADEPTREDVRAALSVVSKKHGQDKAMALLKKFGGVAGLSKLKDEKFQAVIDAAKKLSKK